MSDHKVVNLSSRYRDTTIVDIDVDEIGNDEPVNLAKFIELLQALLESIPPNYRDSAVFYVRSYGEDASVSNGVEYQRPETDAEMAARIEWLDQLDRDTEARERQAYERLKNKFDADR